MAEVTLTIDNRQVKAEAGKTVLESALGAGIYIPSLCHHPDLPDVSTTKPSEYIYRGEEKIECAGEIPEMAGGCRLCLVHVQGVDGLSLSCSTEVKEGMVITTDSREIQAQRKKNLALILVDHPHACLTCAQREGCTREPCSSNVAVNERCCAKFGNCEVQKVAEYIGIPEDTLRYIWKNLPVISEDPLYNRDFNLCIGCLRCVRACNALRGCDVLGFAVQKGKVIVGPKKAPFLPEADCRFCGACVEVCPTGALTDKSKVVEANRERTLVPCKANCPAGIDIPRYVRFIAEGNFGAAAAVVREKVPFPGVLGQVCYHPCETVCRRKEVNDSVSICALKGIAARNDNGQWKTRAKTAPTTGKKVAIIGSGPAGLTAAYYLAKLGHEVTVFEGLSEAGGMMRVGMSEKTLPREILDEDIAAIVEAGVAIETNRPINSLPELFAAGYAAIFIALGAPHKKFNLVFSKQPDIMKEWGLQASDWASFGVNSDTLATNQEGVFSGGDIVRGPALVKKRRA